MSFRDQLEQATERVLKRLQKPNDRLHSWGHCYRHFWDLPSKPTEAEIDLMALNLAFYLASYGMYRGSTALLGYDYRILAPVVSRILQGRPEKAEISVLAAVRPERADETWAKKEGLEKTLHSVGIKQRVMDTLSTKIMLGTCATSPALDSYFLRAVKSLNMGRFTSSRTNFKRIYAEILSHHEIFQEQVDRFHKAGHNVYPAMRVVDLVLWEAGGGDSDEG